MITKIIGCADIHIKNLDGLDNIKESLKLFIKDVKKIIKGEESPDNVRVVIAGDLFEQKINITNEAQITAYWFIKELGKLCKTYIIAGNHDYIVDNLDRMDSITPLFEIGKPDNVIYLDSELDYDSGVYVDDNVVWHLFSSFSGFADTNVEANRAKYPDKVHIGLVHGDINGAETYKDYITDRGLDPGMFKGLDFVIAGHIHKRQVIKKNGVPIIYCSSLMQKDFGEGVTGHGYVIWDLAKGNEYIFKDLPIVKGYYQYSIHKIDDIQKNKEKFENL